MECLNYGCMLNIRKTDRKFSKISVNLILRLIGPAHFAVSDTSLVLIIMWIVNATLIRIQIFGISRYLPKP